ncbi:MAG: ParA family protein [Gammaproteobacteria bacterium]
MPTIAFVSPKGGVGKTTAAVLLATEIAQKGKAVTLIDADPNKPISAWSRQPGVPENLSVISEVDEESIIDEIETAEAQSPFVIVDLEGTANLMVGYAISRCDFVIIPSQGSQLDAKEATKAIRLIQQQEKAFKRTIPYAVLLTRTSAAIKTRSLRHIQDQLQRRGVQLFGVQIIEREAFRAIFSFGGTLERLDRKEVSGVESAIINARAFAGEVIDRIRQSAGQPQKQTEVA